VGVLLASYYGLHQGPTGTLQGQTKIAQLVAELESADFDPYNIRHHPHAYGVAPNDEST
jgi:hypothetical protein